MNPPRLALLLLLAATPARAAGPPPASSSVTFEQHVRPILKAYCFECHGEARKPKGALDLRLRRLMVKGGDTGPAVVPGKPEGSLLYERVLGRQMPPGKVKLPAHEIQILRDWIAAGAPARPEPDKLPEGFHLTDEERNFWSFRPITRVAVPGVKQASLTRTHVDAFILSRLEAAGLSFSAPADRLKFLRRATFDLTGLPPTPSEVDDFLADSRPDAEDRLIDRLLASPGYGERWGRHWLDVAGYADSHGSTGDDPVRPYSWKYRDWVLRALDADMPFDRFVIEQLAGDELAPRGIPLTAEDQDRLIATGFLRTAPDGTASGVSPKEAGNQLVADTLQVVSTALLGITVHCAQCHNHKYDPISQADYYRLRAVFEPAYDVAHWRTPPGRLVSLMTPAERERGALVEREAGKIDAERQKKVDGYIEQTFQKQMAKVPMDMRAVVEKAYRTPGPKRSAEQNRLLQQYPSVNVSAGSLYLYDSKAAADLTALAKKAADIRATKPVEDFIDALTEVPGQVPVTRLFSRGDPEQPREELLPGVPAVLAGSPGAAIPAKEPGRAGGTTGRRLAFARYLTSGKHPLLARVIVNRVWMHHFGTGLVATPGDLGMLGARPTHPELLDWLASEFMRDWSLKRLHRLILRSAVYAQSSARNEMGQRIDPENRLLWRMPVRRLEGEAVRDAILSVAGRLDRKRSGSPVPVMPDTGGQVVLGVDRRDGAGYLTLQDRQLGNDVYRRSVYVQIRRSLVLTVLETFDPPVLSPSCEKRNFSTVAPQALLLMNSSFTAENGLAFAARLSAEKDDLSRVRLGWKLAYGRAPTSSEEAGALAFLEALTRQYQARPRGKSDPEPGRQALATWCQALMSSNPFLYVD